MLWEIFQAIWQAGLPQSLPLWKDPSTGGTLAHSKSERRTPPLLSLWLLMPRAQTFSIWIIRGDEDVLFSSLGQGMPAYKQNPPRYRLQLLSISPIVGTPHFKRAWSYSKSSLWGRLYVCPLLAVKGKRLQVLGGREAPLQPVTALNCSTHPSRLPALFIVHCGDAISTNRFVEQNGDLGVDIINPRCWHRATSTLNALCLTKELWEMKRLGCQLE